jgi:hypothetical protein
LAFSSKKFEISGDHSFPLPRCLPWRSRILYVLSTALLLKAYNDRQQLGSDPKQQEALDEKTCKTESGLASENFRDPSVAIEKHKPRLEDFIFFAAAQRAAEREEDKKTCAILIFLYLMVLILYSPENPLLPINSSNSLPTSYQLVSIQMLWGKLIIRPKD